MLAGITATARQLHAHETELTERQEDGRPTKLIAYRIAATEAALAHLGDVAREGGLTDREIEVAIDRGYQPA
ncbi:hypothetical protein ACFUYE_00700 [Micromonospora humida]|uniref:hypothetical protein n=1 Tax=Micromonospora humida TaxID=2809018 RepID=UPI003670AAAE